MPGAAAVVPKTLHTILVLEPSLSESSAGFMQILVNTKIIVTVIMYFQVYLLLD